MFFTVLGGRRWLWINYCGENMSRNTKFIILCMVILGIFIVVATESADNKEMNFEEFITDVQMKAAEGDKDAEMLMREIRMTLGTSDDSDYESEKLLSAFLPWAKVGYVGAESIVGHAYYKAGDMVKAAFWLERSAEQGNSNSYYYLARIYVGGDGVEQDIDKTIKYLEKSAELGNVNAMSTLATIYNYGEYGVPIDYKKAKRWAEPAADKGDIDAQKILGFLYYDGNGVEVDYGKAQKWLTLVASQVDSPKLWVDVGALYLNINNLFRGVVQDDEKAYYWLQKSVDRGNTKAQVILGWLYCNGICVDRNFKKGYKLFKLASESGNNIAQSFLGEMYQNALYVEQDYNEALKLFKISGEQGNPVALYNVGWIYEKGLGVKKNIEKACEWYRKSASLGNIKAEGKVNELSANE